MQIPDDQECLRIALEQIAEHGDEVGIVLNAQIEALQRTDRVEELAKWLLIRNTVGFILDNGLTKH
jgi:hypothetical protein